MSGAAFDSGRTGSDVAMPREQAKNLLLSMKLSSPTDLNLFFAIRQWIKKTSILRGSIREHYFNVASVTNMNSPKNHSLLPSGGGSNSAATNSKTKAMSSNEANKMNVKLEVIRSMAGTLLLQRLLRAFQQRPPQSSRGSAKTKQSTANDNAETQTNFTSRAPSTLPATPRTEQPSLPRNGTSHSAPTKSPTPQSLPVGSAQRPEGGAGEPSDTTVNNKMSTQKKKRPLSLNSSTSPNSSGNKKKVKVSQPVFLALAYLGSDLWKLLQAMTQNGTVVTVAEVTEYCRQLLDTGNKSERVEILTALYQAFHFNTQQSLSSSLPVGSRLHPHIRVLRAFLLEALDMIRAQAVEEAELAFDFDVVYQACCQDPGLQKALDSLEQAKQAASKLTRCIKLRDHFHRFEDDSTPRRRVGILGIATSLSFLAILGKLVPVVVVNPSAPSAPPPILQEHKIAGKSGYNAPDLESDSEAGQIKDAEGSLNNTSTAQGRKRRIANARVPPETKTEVLIDLSAEKQTKNKREEFEVTSVVLDTVNRLCTFLAWASPNHHDICAFTEQELETSVLELFAKICSLPTVMQASNDDTWFQGDDQLRKGSSSTSSPFNTLLRSYVPKLPFIRHHHRDIIQSVVMETEQLLRPSTSAPTPLERVLFLAPTVVGEPWNLPWVNPEITCQFFCRYKTERPPMSLSTSPSPASILRPSERQQKEKPNNRTCMDDPRIVAVVAPSLAKTTVAAIAPTAEIVPVPTQTTATRGGDRLMADSGGAVGGSSATLATGATVPNKKARIEVTPVATKLLQSTAITDAMELNEWAVSIMSLTLVKPSARLWRFLDGTSQSSSSVAAANGNDSNNTMGIECSSSGEGARLIRNMIVPILNRALSRIQKLNRNSVYSHADGNDVGTRISLGKNNGQAYVNGEVTDDVQFCASVIGFYYHALEAIIADDNSRDNNDSKNITNEDSDEDNEESNSKSDIDYGEDGDDNEDISLGISQPSDLRHRRRNQTRSTYSYVRNESFHRGLLACCYGCVLRALGTHPNMAIGRNFHVTTVFTMLEMIECSPSAYLRVTETFYRALVSQENHGNVGSPSSSLSSGNVDSKRRSSNVKKRRGNGDGTHRHDENDVEVAAGPSPLLPGLPRILQRHVKKCETQIIDAIVWMKNISSLARTSTTASIMNENEKQRGRYNENKDDGDSKNDYFHDDNDVFNSHQTVTETIRKLRRHRRAWPPDPLEPVLPEEMEDLSIVAEERGGAPTVHDVTSKPAICFTPEASFLNYVLRKALKMAFFRIQALCEALGLTEAAVIERQILVAFRHMLRSYIEVFFDRHIDQILLCCVYGVCKILRVAPEVTFTRIIEAYLAVRGPDLGEKACQLIVRHIKLITSERDAEIVVVTNAGQRIVGDIIMFYNQVFLCNMKGHFLKSKSLKRAAEHISAYNVMLQNMVMATTTAAASAPPALAPPAPPGPAPPGPAPPGPAPPVPAPALPAPVPAPALPVPVPVPVPAPQLLTLGPPRHTIQPPATVGIAQRSLQQPLAQQQQQQQQHQQRQQQNQQTQMTANHFMPIAPVANQGNADSVQAQFLQPQKQKQTQAPPTPLQNTYAAAAAAVGASATPTVNIGRGGPQQHQNFLGNGTSASQQHR